MGRNKGEICGLHKTKFFLIDISELIALKNEFIGNTENQFSTLKDGSPLEPFEDNLLAEVLTTKDRSKVDDKVLSQSVDLNRSKTASSKQQQALTFKLKENSSKKSL